MDESFVTVFRTHDPIQAEMLEEILQNNGISARLIGTRRGPMIAVAQHILELRIEVPEADARHAAELIAAFGPFDTDAPATAPSPNAETTKVSE